MTDEEKKGVTSLVLIATNALANLQCLLTLLRSHDYPVGDLEQQVYQDAIKIHEALDQLGLPR